MLTGASGQTIFEIGICSYPLTGILFPLTFVIFGLIVIRHRKEKPDYLALRALIIIVATLVFIVIQSSDISTFMKLRNAYLSGESTSVEGVVENSQRAYFIDKTDESFSVHGVVFKFRIMEKSPCFHDSPLEHGLIRDGMNVRIYYSEECIQRIDILQK